MEEFRAAVVATGSATLRALARFEAVSRRLHPPALPTLRKHLAALGDELGESVPRLRDVAVPEGLDGLQQQLLAGATYTLDALEKFVDDDGGPDATFRVIRALRGVCRAQEALFPLRLALPAVGRFFAEAPWHERLDTLEPDPAPKGVSVGIFSSSEHGEDRGGFSLYVPESYDGEGDWPLVVALHGGMGSGRDFLWTWLREARSRRFLLLAPTSIGATWSFTGSDADGPQLRASVEHVAERWRVDRSRILLTGLSDGATYTLLTGLAQDSPFTALAPVSGVLHPANLANGNLGRAASRRIYLVHGALDWMFPVALAQVAAESLRAAGADLVYRELEDLSHTYPRDENPSILEWFDPSLGR